MYTYVYIYIYIYIHIYICIYVHTLLPYMKITYHPNKESGRRTLRSENASLPELSNDQIKDRQIYAKISRNINHHFDHIPTFRNLFVRAI
jgi:hypothetical protein